MDPQTPRRFLPSTAILAAFEATARTGSMTLAARELQLTQSAVSRQIKILEEQLEVELFVRERQTVRLTLVGESYAREVREALHKISTASFNLHANPRGGTLNLVILPTFGTRWLAPRLPRFLAANPGITINLTTRLSYFDFRAESLDAAIHFGQPEWPGAEMALLRSEQVVPACSPGVKRQYRFSVAGDLRKAPLLSISTRFHAWDRWFSVHDVSGRTAQGMVFDQFATAAQAAIAGLGVALLPTFLIQDELASRKLVRALNLPMESPERYYLVWPSERAKYPPLAAFREWLVTETAPDR
ncbi:LysR family transcriptional regulator [Bradyrhizobium sp. CCGUVB1N3]|uniref:LysR family transcriptional regulator n=1 Tax=Bradyrhizobium sp. CCGUVB1N3 TaxID=2949629 RepID=UPI0020B421A5|nr:LysR family transcriptional regulator [Bradyrhizobium sp. CCGUVB1N3]MCP3468989.1 LysR family transcriptional regulator [Bradyrhizobium sp. CCGUVB1N3]